MSVDMNPERQAAHHEYLAEAARALAAHSRWGLFRWWLMRRARKYDESADIWRGLAWRRDQAFKTLKATEATA